jgi:translation initiation factor IF-2
MRKIRINELARELEVKPGVIIDLLPELGVQEKKTHSSSVDEEVAIALRDRLIETGVIHPYAGRSNGFSHESEDHEPVRNTPEQQTQTASQPEEAQEQPVPSTATEVPKPAAAVVATPAVPRFPLRPPTREAARPSAPPAMPLIPGARPSQPEPPTPATPENAAVTASAPTAQALA